MENLPPQLKVRISLEGKPFEWVHLKQKYLANPKRYAHAIKQANCVRASLVRSLLDDVIGQVDPSKRTFYRADGSTDLTSDFDVSMAGAQKEAVTIAFNEQFEDLFDRPSAEVFDTNIYGSGPIEEVEDPKGGECKGNFACSSACMKKTDKCFLITQLRFRHSPAVVNNQHSWAIAALLRNMSPEEQVWLETKINTGTKSTKLLRRLFALAQKIYIENPLAENIHLANKKYAEALQRLYQLRISGLKNVNTKDFALKYADAESLAGYTAQEAYVTMGPFLHIVGVDQRQLDLALSQDEYKDSFIENMAYVLHNFKSGASCSKAFVMAAKYIARAAFAATQVFDNTTEEEMVSELDQLVTASVQIRAQRESLLTRADKQEKEEERVERPMVVHMRGVSCDQENKSRVELLQWIYEYLVLMF